MLRRPTARTSTQARHAQQSNTKASLEEGSDSAGQWWMTGLGTVNASLFELVSPLHEPRDDHQRQGSAALNLSIESLKPLGAAIVREVLISGMSAVFYEL